MNDLSERSQTGMRIALGSGTFTGERALSPLAILYCALILLGASPHRRPAASRLRVAFCPGSSNSNRLRPFLVLGVGVIGLLAGLALLVLLLLGFPVENQFRQFIFTTRTGWLEVVVLVNLGTILASLQLWRVERSARP